ncbi:hypothetical protein Y10_05020 [Neptunitalea sp. Y10]|uniref:O-antigen ligase-related domain-containing protein n=1 Tax=Neptunitalea lumnitzerae TaxID=2965509 RepID=A0ABQ5MFG9_9FLAO|nr:hypothetical protein Y10_05020 [Neptunitalea sp. Y10]
MLIASTLIFRKFSTICILIFVAFNLLTFNRLKYDRKKLIWWVIVAIPFLLDVLFLWNNDSLGAGLKSAEKRLSFIIFPTFLLGYYKAINFKWFLKLYGYIMVVIVFMAYGAYAYNYPEHVIKYYHGKHLWEMGYHFANFVGIHAPAFNLHMSFVSISCLYLLFAAGKRLQSKLISGLFLLLSLVIVMYINTRVAVVITLLGYGVVCFFELFKNKNIYKAVKISALLFSSVILIMVVFVKVFPYSVEKYTKGSFSDMEYVGNLDAVEHPEIRFFNKLVTRVSIWKSALELAEDNWIIGYGASDARNELVNYYKETDQQFLAKYEFPTHNQYIDFLLKFGVLGFIGVICFMFGMGYLGWQMKHPVVISFCLLFFISNLTDDFLIRYDGITFSALWFAIFANQYFYNTKITGYVEKD